MKLSVPVFAHLKNKSLLFMNIARLVQWGMEWWSLVEGFVLFCSAFCFGAGGLEAKSQDWRADAMGWQGLTSRAGERSGTPVTNNTAQTNSSLIVYVCTCSLGAW